MLDQVFSGEPPRSAKHSVEMKDDIPLGARVPKKLRQKKLEQ